MSTKHGLLDTGIEVANSKIIWGVEINKLRVIGIGQYATMRRKLDRSLLSRSMGLTSDP